ncbi:MAG: methionyl-tRNA formyltransferase [Streptosporangiales bacterium]
MRIVFAGTPEPAVPSLNAVLASRHELVAAVTRPDRPAGRGRRTSASPIAERAAAAGVEVLKPGLATDADFVARLRALRPDCCAVVAYGALLPEPLLRIPTYGWINLHFSVLPAWRGAAPVQHAIRAGDDVTGATVFSLVREMDAGPVYGTVTEPVGSTDTTGGLIDRLADSGADLLVRVLDGIEEATLQAVPQAGEPTYAPKVTTADARIDWTAPARAVDRQVRSVTPAPGAWTRLRGRRLKLGPVEPLPDGAGPGLVSVTRQGVTVGTAAGSVRLGTVQPEGRGPVDAGAWARGVHDLDGGRLGD